MFIQSVRPLIMLAESSPAAEWVILLYKSIYIYSVGAPELHSQTLGMEKNYLGRICRKSYSGQKVQLEVPNGEPQIL